MVWWESNMLKFPRSWWTGAHCRTLGCRDPMSAQLFLQELEDCRSWNVTKFSNFNEVRSYSLSALCTLSCAVWTCKRLVSAPWPVWYVVSLHGLFKVSCLELHAYGWASTDCLLYFAIYCRPKHHISSLPQAGFYTEVAWVNSWGDLWP